MDAFPKSVSVLSISAFTEQVKSLLEQQIGDCWVKGEISNLRRQVNGHCYFSLKDSFSQVSAVIFRRWAEDLDIELEDGMQVIAYGRASVYEPRGQYQLILHVILEEGRGRLQMEFERLKKLLRDEGLFDASRKQPIPRLPETIAFITSPTGAVLQDFISILRRREWKGRLIVFPSKVQGREATEELVDRIAGAAQLGCIDLLVIGRGGGSLEDLWPFNEEAVARAIAACPLPVISAVGHEVDFTLSDFVADLRAETPSAAAELVSAGAIQLREQFESMKHALEEAVLLRMERIRNRFSLCESKLKQLSPVHLIEGFSLRLDDYHNRFNAALREQLGQKRDKLNYCEAKFDHQKLLNVFQLASMRFKYLQENYYSVAQKKLSDLSNKLDVLTKRLSNTAPERMLKRGFVIVKDIDGNIISSGKDLKVGNCVYSQFHDVEIKLRVDR